MLLTQAGAYTRGNISQFADPLVSPVYADYAALFPAGVLPPTMIQVGLREVLLSDAVRLYHKMKQAAPAPRHLVLSPYEGMWHVFQSYIDVPEAEVASREMAEYFLRALDGSVCK
jgi:acetyl esterase/lipase